MDIFETHRLAVDEVFALPNAVITARHRNLVILRHGENLSPLLRVVERDRNLRIAHRTALLGAGEYHVLHFSAADILGGHLAEHPAHRVGYIRFSASVGSHNDRNPAVKRDDRLVRKRFKALKFKRFQTHFDNRAFPAQAAKSAYAKNIRELG